MNWCRWPPTPTQVEQRLLRLFCAMQDANFNVLGLVNSSGSLVERYEYTPYGQRKVLFAAGNTWAGGTSAMIRDAMRLRMRG